jgi:hypothetical protein
VKILNVRTIAQAYRAQITEEIARSHGDVRKALLSDICLQDQALLRKYGNPRCSVCDVESMPLVHLVDDFVICVECTTKAQRLLSND